MIFSIYNGENNEETLAIWSRWFEKKVLESWDQLVWTLKVNLTPDQWDTLQWLDEEELYATLVWIKKDNQLYVENIQ